MRVEGNKKRFRALVVIDKCVLRCCRGRQRDITYLPTMVSQMMEQEVTQQAVEAASKLIQCII